MNLDVLGRVWEETEGGKWCTREMTADEQKRREIFERWNRGEIKYKQVLKELAELDV